MDYSTREARKILRDYFDWYWSDYYEKRWKETQRRLGRQDSISFHEAVNRAFGYEDKKPFHEKVDHTLDTRRGIEKGVLISPQFRDHDEVIKELMDLCKTIELTDLTSGFLYSLSTGKNQYRTALASYFFSRGLTEHKAERIHLTNGHDGCCVCGLNNEDKNICHIEDSLSRYTLYYPQHATIGYIQKADYALFDLKQFKELLKVEYTKEDINILVGILKLAETMGPNNNFTALQKLITRSKMVNASGNEINVILGVLSVCGVLQTPEHQGYAQKFTGCGDRGFQGYETEYFYPLYYWRGRHGVDKKALADVFPSCVSEALEGDTKQVSLKEIYSNGKDTKPSGNRAEAAFPDDRHIIELDDRKRHYYGLSALDPKWHKEVRYSVTHKIYKRTEVYFDGNSIKKVIYEEKILRDNGSFSTGEYLEKDMAAETEDRFLLLPKTSRGKKKPWTPSLLDFPTYVTATLRVSFDRKMIISQNWQNWQSLPLHKFGTEAQRHISSPIEFYTFTEEYIRNLPDDYEEVLKRFRSV